MRNPRAKIVPSAPSIGDVVEVKTLITHVMETGSRKDRFGKLVPRNIITRFCAEFNGAVVFEADIFPGISANPYLSFKMRVSQPGTFRLTWVEDSGQEAQYSIPLKVA